jgi:hypothetical protein
MDPGSRRCDPCSLEDHDEVNCGTFGGPTGRVAGRGLPCQGSRERSHAATQADVIASVPTAQDATPTAGVRSPAR